MEECKEKPSYQTLVFEQKVYVKLVQMLKLEEADMKLSAIEFETWVLSAEIWAEESHFHLTQKLTQQQYFKMVVAQQLWQQMEKGDLEFTLKDCIQVVKWVYKMFSSKYFCAPQGHGHVGLADQG